MKRYVPIIIGVVALCAVLFVGNYEMKKRNAVEADTQTTQHMGTQTFNGKVMRQFEGENTLEYTFEYPNAGTTTIEKDGALVKVSDNATPIVAMYISYEGGRGYSPADYITNVIVPSVKAITEVGTTTIGSYEWDVVESEWSVWHVGKVANGNWLLVVENRKTENEKALPIIESIVTK